MSSSSHGASSAASLSAESYQWAYSIVDSSRVSTFFISILLIVYGSFRSLALEEDGKEGGKDGAKAEDKESLLAGTVPTVRYRLHYHGMSDITWLSRVV